jgi:hypothetical protein
VISLFNLSISKECVDEPDTILIKLSKANCGSGASIMALYKAKKADSEYFERRDN